MIHNETLQRRLTLVGIGLIAISAILLVRLISFQFRMDPQIKQTFASQAENRYNQTVEVMPNRGQIFDRNGHLLAGNSFEYRIGISPNQVVDRQETVAQLAPLVGMSEDKLYRRLLPDENGVYASYALLASVVSFETGQAIADLDIDGIIIEPLPTRIYPQGDLTAQIVGFFAGSESARTRRGYYVVEGLRIAAGRAEQARARSPSSRAAPLRSPVRDGISLVLTIDRDLQHLGPEILDKAVVDHGHRRRSDREPAQRRDPGDGEQPSPSRKISRRKPAVGAQPGRGRRLRAGLGVQSRYHGDGPGAGHTTCRGRTTIRLFRRSWRDDLQLGPRLA